MAKNKLYIENKLTRSKTAAQGGLSNMSKLHELKEFVEKIVSSMITSGTVTLDTSTGNNNLSKNLAGELYSANEVITSTSALSGSAPTNSEFGIDKNNSKLYLNQSGIWDSFRLSEWETINLASTFVTFPKDGKFVITGTGTMPLLPSPVTYPNHFIALYNNSGSSKTITASVGNIVENATSASASTYVLLDKYYVFLLSDGTNWNSLKLMIKEVRDADGDTYVRTEHTTDSDEVRLVSKDTRVGSFTANVSGEALVTIGDVGGAVNSTKVIVNDTAQTVFMGGSSIGGTSLLVDSIGGSIKLYPQTLERFSLNTTQATFASAITLFLQKYISSKNDGASSRVLYTDGATGELKIGNATIDINALTADGSPDGAADYLMTYDASAGTNKKVLINTIVGGGGGVTSVNGSTGVVSLDSDDILEGVTNLYFSTAEASKLSAIEANADVTDADNIAIAIDGSPSKATPVNGDTFAMIDSAGGSILSTVSWSNIKTTLASLFVSTVNGSTGTVVLDADDISDAATTNKFTTSAEISKLSGIETNADVTDTGNVGTSVHGSTAKTSFVAADKIAIIDTQASNVLKTITRSVLDQYIAPLEAIPIVVSDEDVTAITTGTNKIRFRMPYGFTLVSVKASLNTASTGAALVIDINLNGSSIFTTNQLVIDTGATTSVGSAVTPNITTTSLTDDGIIGVDVDSIGTGAKSLKIWLIGRRTVA